ncbi:hypothetical protein ACFDTO_33200 [Microbacteriaceae bacterium 4G12]
MIFKKIKKPIIVLSAATMFSFAIMPVTSTFAATQSPTKNIEAISNERTVQVFNNAGEHTTYGLKLKAISYAFRTGGWLLEQILKPFSKKNAALIRSKSKAIADKLDEITKVTTLIVASALRSAGLPDDVAETLATIIVGLVL